MTELFLEAKELFIDTIITYLQNLDWKFIITLMILVRMSTYYLPSKDSLKVWKWELKFKASYRVAILGAIMSLLYAWLNNGDTKEHVQLYFQSMIAAMAIHAWVLPLFKSVDLKKYFKLPSEGLKDEE